MDSVSGPLEALGFLPSLLSRAVAVCCAEFLAKNWISCCQVAVQLATRYEACETLEPSIALTRFTLRQVELVLERDDDEHQGRIWQIRSVSIYEANAESHKDLTSLSHICSIMFYPFFFFSFFFFFFFFFNLVLSKFIGFW